MFAPFLIFFLVTLKCFKFKYYTNKGVLVLRKGAVYKPVWPYVGEKVISILLEYKLTVVYFIFWRWTRLTVWRRPGKGVRPVTCGVKVARNLIPTVKIGGGSVTVWGCLAAGHGWHGTVNFAVYQYILKENVPPSVPDLRLKHAFVLQSTSDCLKWWSGLVPLPQADCDAVVWTYARCVWLQQFCQDTIIVHHHCRLLLLMAAQPVIRFKGQLLFHSGQYGTPPPLIITFI